MKRTPTKARLVAIRDFLAAARIALDHQSPRFTASHTKPWKSFRKLLAGAPQLPDAALTRLAEIAIQAELTVYIADTVPSLAIHLARAAARAKRRHALLELASAQIKTSLDPYGLGASLVLLKGSASGHWAYSDPEQRQRRDLDVLLSPREFPRIRAALWNTGWRDSPVQEAGRLPFHGRTFGMSLKLGAATVSLDLHRDLISPHWCGLAGDEFREQFLTRAIKRPAALPVTDPLDTFLHTVAHIVHSGFYLPAKTFIDLQRLLPLIDPSVCAQRLSQYRLRTAAWACLGVVESWFGADTANLRDPLRPAASHAKLITRVLNGVGPYAISPSVPRWRAIHGIPILLADR